MAENLNPVSTETVADAGQEQVVAVQENPENAGQEAVVESQGEVGKSAESAELENGKKHEQSREDNSVAKLARQRAEQEAARKVAEAEARARDKAAAEMAKALGIKTRDGKDVGSYEDFEIAKRDWELQQKGYNVNEISELIQNDPLIRKANEVLESQKKRESQAAEFGEFMNYFKEEYGRAFDPTTDKIPAEVLAAQKQGVKLKDAYIPYRLQEMKAEMADMRKKLQADETNRKNADSAVGSVKSDGQTGTGDFITFDTFEANKHDQKWLMKNMSAVLKSRAKWQ